MGLGTSEEEHAVLGGDRYGEPRCHHRRGCLTRCANAVERIKPMTDRGEIQHLILYLNNRLREKERQLKRAELRALCWSSLCFVIVVLVIVLGVM